MHHKWFLKMDEAAADGAASGAAEGVKDEQGSAESQDKGGSEGDGKEVTPDWSPDWRQKFAGDDEKLLKRFERFNSPVDVAKAWVAAQQKISSGELKPTLGKDASAEEIAQYRKDLGIPETPDKYEIKLGDGLVIGDEDKPLIDEFLKVAHASNQTPEQVNATVSAFYAVQEKLAEDRAEQDKNAQLSGEEALRTEWGQEFKSNLNMIHGLLDTVASPELKEKFLSGRLADGTPIGSDPDALKMLAGLARQVNPAGTVVPPSANQAQAIDSEIADIESKMGTKEYTKNEKMQQRYRDLVEAKLQLERKAG